MQLQLDNLLKVLKAKAYKVFDKGDFNLNLVGVRTVSKAVNTFDDWMTLCYQVAGQWNFHVWPCTTDPGIYWLNNPENIAGTAILKPGQYPGSHMLGKHQGRYEALVQKTPLPVYRDANKDSVLDMNPDTLQIGVFGINIHRANEFKTSVQVDKWSAGCQVLADPFHFDLLLQLCKKGAELHGNSFTYTLVEEQDFKL